MTSSLLQVTFLGTGTSQGVPVIACDCMVCMSNNEKDQRLRASILLEIDNKTLVIDAGPDFRQQMLRAKVHNVDAIVFTHKHKDHIAGLDDIRAYNYRQRKAMPIYADDVTYEAIKNEYSYIFDGSNYPGVPKVEYFAIDHNPFVCEGVSILPIPVLHLEMTVWGFRLGNFAYITDANFIPESSMQKLQNLDVLVLNALRKEKHPSHFSLSEAIEIVQQLAPKVTYFTHISHLLGTHQDVSIDLPPNVFLAYDGLKLQIPII